MSTTNRKCHKLFALFLVNIWIVQSCYFVHCLHLPRCLYYTQCHHSMSSFSPLPYLHYLLHHLHRCIIFLFIFRTVLAFIIIVLTSITAIVTIDEVFARMGPFKCYVMQMGVGGCHIFWGKGAIQVVRNAIFLEIGPPPTPS